MRLLDQVAAGADKQFGIDAEGIRIDLTDAKEGGERPAWPFSAYAPGKDAPKQLLEGALEQSPEEMRVQCYIARASGQEQQYAQQEEALLAQVNQQIQTIKSDLEGARRFIVDGQNEHPNRNDQVLLPSSNFARPSGGPSQASGFGTSNTSTPSTFGQPTGPRPAFGAASSMAQSSGAFGQPSQLGAGSGFGKPSSLGGGSGSGFGQASSLGQQNSPFGGAPKPAAFGQPSQPGASTGGFASSSQPAFGQSGFGSAPKPAFGTPSQPTGAFGQPSQPSRYGQPPQPSAFGQPSQPASNSGFGQPSQSGGQPSAFGQPSQPGQPSAFGKPSQPSQPSAFGQPSQPAGFGQPSQPSGFGQPSQPANPFVNKPSPFGQTPQSQSSPFVTAGQNQQSRPNPFGGPSDAQSSSGGGTLFGARPTPSNTTSAAPNGKSVIRPASSSQATSWKGKPLTRDKDGNPCLQVADSSKPSGRRLERVWFPDGPPPTNVQNEGALLDPEAPQEVYEGPLGRILQGLYGFALTEGKFKDGIVPEVPPKMAWVGHDI
ncbi:Hypothetical predicted protein [Lecanosticta acicola]|uniref:Uncharacterized protein n=1 Tax=Lecanosticta acicola TaxID=111012 RepID=A0AAI8YWX2_9PEZI|nr:Hypothetical predicted protein [Lecanosticta acicola]